MGRFRDAVAGRRHARWLGATAALLASVLVAAAPTRSSDPDPGSDTPLPAMEVFWSEGCPYCEAELRWLETLQDRYPDLRVLTYELSGDAANRELLQQRAVERGLEIRGVPVTLFGDASWVGFDERVATAITSAVEGQLADRSPAPESTQVRVPLVGTVDVASTSLVAATLLIAALDGLNPCSLWVLSLLLALVLHTRSRRRVLAIGLTFLTVTAAMYALYLGGLYSLLSYVAYVTWVRIALAVVAATFGALAVKDFLAPGRGISTSIPEHRKPAIYRRMRAVSAGDRPLLPVLGGTAVLAVGVSLVETPCTAGFPVIWTNLLADQGVTGAGALGLFALYMLVFLADELAVFGVAVVTMRAAKLQERHGRLLKLGGGTVMLALAGTMVVAPDALTTLGGTLVVFTLAGIGAILLAVFTSRHRADRPERPGTIGPSPDGRRAGR